MSTFKQQYRTILHRIHAKKNPMQGTIAFLSNESLPTVKKYASALCNEAFFRKIISGPCFPSKISSLAVCSNMPYYAELDRTLLWFVLSLKVNATQINDFLAIRNQFDRALLLGNYNQCFDLLDNCHQLFGWSMWEIRNRIAVLSEHEGIDAQKQYTKTLLSELSPGSVPYYLVGCFSKQCERNMSVDTYLKHIQSDYERFLENNTPQRLCYYVRYKANGYMLVKPETIRSLSPSTLSYFLCEDSYFPLVDRYISLVDIAGDIFSTPSNNLCHTLLPYLVDLSKVISDPFLLNVTHTYQTQHYYFHSEGADHICYIFDLYSSGEYESCISETAPLLQKNAVFFPLVELYAKCCVYLQSHIPVADQNCLMSTIIHRLHQLFSRSGDMVEIQFELVKILYTHLDSPWARELLYIIEKYNNRTVVLEDIKVSNYFSAISLPDNIFQFPEEFLDSYIKEMPSFYQNSTTTQFAIAVRSQNVDALSTLSIDPIRRQKYEAKLLLRCDPQNALNILESIRKRPECASIRLELDALRIDANMQLGNLLHAMEIFVPAFFENSNFIYIGSIDRIFTAIKSDQYDVSSSILTPILCCLYFNYFPSPDDRDDIILAMSYDDYLSSCNVQRPSELLTAPPKNATEAELTRFLAEVCIPNVMDRSLAFSSYDDILRERIMICEALVDRDSEYRDKYLEEIRRLTHSLLIRLAKREVENSKIYVDLESMRTLLVKEISEAYERYQEFRKNNLSDVSFQILNALREEAPKTIVYVLEDNKQLSMLSDIIKRIRDIYVADNKYGLDGCLSVRIRHGTLESQLRSCFEKHKLVTTKAPDGSYRRNTHWLSPNPRDKALVAKVDSIFASFSAKADDIISNIKNNLIQIHTEGKHPEGLFDFVVDENLVSMVSAKLYDNLSFEQFEDIILGLMTKFTEHSLKVVRDALEGEINAAFQQALKDLETNLIQQRKLPINTHGLSDQIANARTDITTELKKISEWFRLTQPGGFSDFSPSLAVTISCESIQYSRSALKINCDTSDIDESILLRGHTLPHFFDIFNILLTNVVQHSGYVESATAKVCICRKAEIVMISVENPVLPGSLDVAKLQLLETQLNQWEHHSYVTREGGSGLHKIKKILSVDLRCNNNITISCQDNSFAIHINADLREVML